MSDFLLPSLRGLAPYVPGEQPREGVSVKLNTNESPFPPSPRVVAALTGGEAGRLNLYSDPTALPLREAIAEEYGLSPQNVFCGNGSDEVLGFAFLAFSDESHPITFPAVSYGFYPVFARLFRATFRTVALNDDFTLPVEPFLNAGGMVAFANPNAPTGISLPLAEVKRIAHGNRAHVVLVDEAYVDFGGQSALALLSECPNLLIVRTFSKSRSLAGARLGYAMAHEAIIEDLERVRNSFHPYNVNRLSMLAGVEAMKDRPYFEACVAAIVRTREETAAELRGLGFHMTPSDANFLFAAHPAHTALEYERALRARGVLIRRWNDPALREHARVSIGSKEQMQRFLLETREILRERNML